MKRFLELLKSNQKKDWELLLREKFSEEEYLEAVRYNGAIIKYISNPSYQVQLEAVKQNWEAIKCIKNPSEQVKLEAVKQNWEAIKYIENPSEELLNLAFSENK